MATAVRQYELVVLGATGYTGKLCAQHITAHLPTDLRWAIAGRSADKLSGLAEELGAQNPDRERPGIEVAQLNRDELDALAKKTTCLITTVGPYHEFGAPVVEACAANGTHYLDCTGEAPWLRDMIGKYHEQAKASGAIMIPQCGIDSVPADMIAWMLVTHIRSTLSVGVTEVINSVQEFSMSPSGGSLSTLLTLADTYSARYIGASLRPYALSPVPGPAHHPSSRPTLASRLLGIRTVPGLGVLTDSPQGAIDTVIVHRSWGLFDGGRYYGRSFRFSEWMRARNALTGVLVHFALVTAMLALVLPPVRWVLKRLVVQPGTGPEIGGTKNDRLVYRAIAVADHNELDTPERASAGLEWTGSGYYLTGLLLAEAAMVILRGEGTTEAQKLGGGILTPATLGQQYVDRMRKAGVKIDVGMMSA